MNIKLTKNHIVLIFCFVIILIKAFQQTTFYFLQGSSFFFPSIDNSYWLFFLSGIPQFISKSVFISIILDICLLVLPIVMFLNENRILRYIYLILLIIFYLYFGSVTFLHKHFLTSIIFLFIPLLFNKSKLNLIFWELIRYYFLFVFSSTGLWKLFRGSIFKIDQFANILKNQHCYNLVHSPDSWFAFVTRFVNNYPISGEFFYLSATILELTFLIGFFTKKYDKTLVVLLVLFGLVNYVFMGINSIEFIGYVIVFIPFDFFENKFRFDLNLQKEQN